MEYFCYISESKVSQFLSQLESGNLEAWEFAESNTEGGKLGLEAALPFNIAKIATSFGRTDMFQTNLKYKQSLVQKLRDLLTGIDNKIYKFNWNILKTDQLIFLSFKGNFSFKHDGNITIFEARHNAEILQLHCSSKYLSDHSETSWSLNHALYQNDNLSLETVFILTSKSKNIFIGSPLYLQHNFENG